MLRLGSALLLSGLLTAATDFGRLARLLARSISYDQALKARAGNKLVLALIYKSKDADSKAHCDGLAHGLSEIAGVKVQGMQLETTVVELTPKLNADLGRIHPAAIYVCPNIEEDIPRISAIARETKILTIASSQSQLKHGLSLGAFQEGDKLSLMVNTTQAKGEGVEFADALMTVAKRVQ